MGDGRKWAGKRTCLPGRILAALLTAALVMQGLPLAAFAEELAPAAEHAEVAEYVEAGEEATLEESLEATSEEPAIDGNVAEDVEPEGVVTASEDADDEALTEAESTDDVSVAEDGAVPATANDNASAEMADPDASLSEEPTLTAQAIDLSTYKTRMNAFINDPRWANGVSWSQIPPKLSTYNCYGCFAYGCDFTTYVYGVNNYQEGQAFYSPSEIRTGDVIRISGHTFVVLERNGNDLYTAEGAWSDAVRIANPGYKVTASGGLTDTWGNAKTFETGYHFDITDDSYVDLGADFYAYIIQSTKWSHITCDLSYYSGRLSLAETNDSRDPRQIWHFVRQSDGSYAISSAYWDDYYIQPANNGTSSGTIINLGYKNGSSGQRWFVSGSGPQYLRAGNCSLFLDVESGYSLGTQLQLYTGNYSSAQQFNVYKLSNDGRTYSKPSKPVASSYTGSSAVAVGEAATLEWSVSNKVNDFDKRTYEVWVTNSTGTRVFERTNLTDNSCEYEFDSPGTYTVQVRAVNSYYRNWYTDGPTSTITVLGEADVEPPVITDFSIASQTDEQIVFDVWATDNVGISELNYESYTALGVGAGRVITPYAASVEQAGEGHWTITMPLRGNASLLGDHHAILVYAKDASGNSTYVKPSLDLKTDNPNPTIFYDYEASPHFTMKLGETIAWSELFSVSGQPRHYEKLAPDHEVLSLDGEVYTATAAGTGTYVIIDYQSGSRYGAVVTVLPDVVDLSGAAVALPYATTPCTGRAITPSPTVTLDGKALSEGTDYQVSYANNVSVGTATVTVTGVGGYEGTATATFGIVRATNGWYTFAGGAKGYGKGGKLVTGWLDLDGGKYWFDDQGRMATGWTDLVVDGKTMHYYFRPSGNLARGSWADIDGKKYWFRASGNMATGWADIDGRKYWFDESGQMVTGWRDIDNGAGATNHYYFRPSGSMATGWAEIDGEHFYFRPSGNMATGFADVTDDAYKRYFDESGRMLTGWQEINGNTYYFRSSGAMQTGTATIDGMAFTFSDKGVLIG